MHLSKFVGLKICVGNINRKCCYDILNVPRYGLQFIYLWFYNLIIQSFLMSYHYFEQSLYRRFSVNLVSDYFFTFLSHTIYIYFHDCRYIGVWFYLNIITLLISYDPIKHNFEEKHMNSP